MADVELPRFPRAGRDIFGLDPVEDSLPPLVLVSGIVSGGGVAQNDSIDSASLPEDKDDGLLDIYDEGLGATFRETPWKKPSKALAAEYRASTMYGDGQAAIWGRADTNFFQMGEGVGLYFLYVRRMIAFSTIAAVLTLPHLLLCFFGDTLTQAELDPLRLLTFAAGNHMLANVSDSSTIAFHPCTGVGNTTVPTLIPKRGATCDDQFLRLLGDPELLLTAEDASYIITACDVLCCALFMMLYAKFLRDIASFEDRADKENVTPADYAVEVRGIPEDSKEEDVIDHFSNLFKLDRPGWTYRGLCCGIGRKSADMPDDVTDCAGVSIGNSLKPVQRTEHSRFDHVCEGSWLAECSLAHPEGAFIRQARKMTSTSEKILHARARVKKVRFTPKSRLRTRRLRRVEGHLAELRNNLERGAHELQSRAQEFQFISWKTSSAFVIFNHQASVSRCLADYARYPLWMQPRELRFKGVHRIKVQRAPEAGNILWENLEVTRRERGRRKTLTLWVTVALLGCSFAILYASKIAEKGFNTADSKSEERCLFTIPAEHGLDPMTPFVGNLDAADECATNDIWVTLEGSPFQSAGQENTCVEPCVDTMDTSRMRCRNGLGFSEYQIATCLCRQEIEEHGAGALEFAQRAGGGCWAYGTKYAVGKLLTVVASTNVVVINFGLKYVLKQMGDFERHPSVTEQAVSNTWKIALALFVNSACVVLLVNVPNAFSLFRSTDAVDSAQSAGATASSSEWYTTTGQALITTIAINVVAPRGPDLVEYIILGPWRRRSFSAAAAITQKQLNKNWKGRNFDLSSRLPITLMMMAVAMTFSPALPVLFPMIAVYLVCTYFGDKFHLLRVCRTPPQYDGRIVKVAVHAMPWMLLCHCLFALFAFSGDVFFASEYVADIFTSDVEGLGLDNSAHQDAARSVTESVKLIYVPYLIIPALLALHALFTSTIGRLLRLSWSLLTCKCIRGSAKINAPRVRITNPPYTEVFERGYPPRVTVPAFFQKEMRWIVREDARGCHFLQKAKSGGRSSPKRACQNGASGTELMLTWEVLRSVYPTHTFHMEDNPAYRDIVITRNVIAKIVELSRILQSIAPRVPKVNSHISFKELGIRTPKSPGGKLWSRQDYNAYTNQTTRVSSPRVAQRVTSP